MHGIIDSKIKLPLSGLKNNEIERIKDALTFDNPAYENAKRYTRYSNISIPPYLTYYEYQKINGHRYLVTPRGFYDEAFERFDYYDDRVYENIKSFPKFNLTLREDQKKAAEAFIECSEDVQHGMIQLPTGKGKSILALYLSGYFKCKTLIVVHKDDLVLGWKKDILLSFPKLKEKSIGLIKAKSRKVGDYITIATIQTLNRLSNEELEELYNSFGFVIQDEVHHCPASSFSLVGNFKAKYRLGLSATPERSDGLTKVMNLYYGDFCYKYESKEKDEDILPVEVYAKESSLFFNPVCKVNYYKGDICSAKVNSMCMDINYKLKSNEEYISKLPYKLRPKVIYSNVDSLIVLNPDYVKLVCKDIINSFNNKHNIVVFFSQKEHCRVYYETISSIVGEKNVQLYYGDSNESNKTILDRAENGLCRITITTYSKSTEGTNVKAWDTCFLVSSINNEKNTEQSIGRIRRSMDGKFKVATVYDYKHSNCYMLASHWSTRYTRYKKLGFKIIDRNISNKRFRRGYNHI